MDNQQPWRWTEETLPVELLVKIIAPSSPNDAVGHVVAAVCRWVCRWWRDAIPPPTSPAIMYDFATIVAGAGLFSLLQWGRTEGLQWNELSLMAAARGGHLDMIKWMRAEGCPWNERVTAKAALGGHLEVLKWLRANGCPLNVWVVNNAVQGGHMDVLEWVVGEEKMEPEQYTWSVAAERGNIEMLEWLRAHQCPNDYLAISAAAAKGQLTAIKWLVEHRLGGILNSRTLEMAAGYGHLGVVKWLRLQGGGRNCVWMISMASRIAVNGHLEVLKYAIADGCPWDETVCSSAAEGGHLEVLQWARENGCTWGIIRPGARNLIARHPEVSKWAKQNGCPWRLK